MYHHILLNSIMIVMISEKTPLSFMQLNQSFVVGDVEIVWIQGAPPYIHQPSFHFLLDAVITISTFALTSVRQQLLAMTTTN